MYWTCKRICPAGRFDTCYFFKEKVPSSFLSILAFLAISSRKGFQEFYFTKKEKPFDPRELVLLTNIQYVFTYRNPRPVLEFLNNLWELGNRVGIGCRTGTLG